MSDIEDNFFEIVKDITDHIKEELRGLPPISPCKPTIFKVGGGALNPKLHEPKVLSIGPYHHGKDHLQKMEREKLRCLKCLLDRQKDQSTLDTLSKYVDAILRVEENARKCYSEPVEFTPDKFVQILLVDGCFIVELMRKYKFDALRDKDDIMMLNQSVKLCHDLMLFENQVPFFVVDQLFDMTETGDSDDDFLSLIRYFINRNSVWPAAKQSVWPAAKQPIGEVSMQKVDHLLGLVHRLLCSSHNRAEEGTRLSINCTCSELQKEGIKFDNSKNINFLDIKFIKGTLIIPQFLVLPESESIFRNLIIYERFLGDVHPCYIIDYIVFMNSLIRTSKDVDICRRNWIFGDLLGNGDTVYHMFSRLAREITLPSKSSYGYVYEKVFKHRQCCAALSCISL